MKYRIECVSLLTNLRSHGEWFPGKDKEMLESIIISCNKEYRGIIEHTLKSQ